LFLFLWFFATKKGASKMQKIINAAFKGTTYHMLAQAYGMLGMPIIVGYPGNMRCPIAVFATGVNIGNAPHFIVFTIGQLHGPAIRQAAAPVPLTNIKAARVAVARQLRNMRFAVSMARQLV